MRRCSVRVGFRRTRRRYADYWLTLTEAVNGIVLISDKPLAFALTTMAATVPAEYGIDRPVTSQLAFVPTVTTPVKGAVVQAAPGTAKSMALALLLLVYSWAVKFTLVPTRDSATFVNIVEDIPLIVPADPRICGGIAGGMRLT